MAKARFYIKDRVQEVGYRTFITEKILNSDLEGSAINLPDGRVEVKLEGEKEHIIQFVEELKKEKPELAKNPEITPLEFDDSLVVPEAMRSSQSILCGQFTKAVGHVEHMGEAMKELVKEIKEMRQELPKEIAKELKEILT